MNNLNNFFKNFLILISVNFYWNINCKSLKLTLLKKKSINWLQSQLFNKQTEEL